MAVLQDVEDLLHCILLPHHVAVVLFLEGDKLRNGTQTHINYVNLIRIKITPKFEKD